MTWEPWRGRPPTLPPAAELGAPIAAVRPENRPSRAMLIGLALVGVIDVMVLLHPAPPRILGLLILTAAALRQVLAHRRRFAAIGPDWFYLREGALARGRWTRISEVKKVTVFNGRKKSTVFLKPAHHRRMFRVEITPTEPNEALRAELARQLVAASTPGSSVTLRSLNSWIAAAV
ncbi:hypothetical protein SAMN05444157_0213 [Frankineae bacterium MT45]|nr:hypothetical protein SAMN05444157_0213 [Frankineae bacterium MT45]